MLLLQNISYAHHNTDVLFSDINLSLNKQNKIALIGNNGSGKSTLLKVIAGIFTPASGTITARTRPYYVPQLFDGFSEQTIGGALGIESKLNALQAILNGNVSEENLEMLNEDWALEERCREAFSYWKLNEIDLTQSFQNLSGGQKTKIFLAGIFIHQPEIILLDEPSNHLDLEARQKLYQFINSCPATIIVVSHDRQLLQLLPEMYELSKNGLKAYGGNYEFYSTQKAIETKALGHELKNKEKLLRKAKDTERETAERQQKLDARGKKKQIKAGVPTIALNTLRNNAEKSTSRIKDVHAEKTGAINDELNALRSQIPEIDKMKLGFDKANLHKGKTLFRATNINHTYGQLPIWGTDMNLEITSGARIALKGSNGSGKTTLIKIILGETEPKWGKVYRANTKTIYIDQDYSLLSNQLTVYELALQFNQSGLQEHEIKIRLNRFLFTKIYWDKHCSTLSGGEKMRLILCCLTISNQAPDMLILDEPTNNLDLQNIEILTNAIGDYEGTILVVSHDNYFIEQLNITEIIEIN
ncbi:MAG: ABC-F family ATP-binding cassette domain-containing protein [Chitinophagaceae bacterium]